MCGVRETSTELNLTLISVNLPLFRSLPLQGGGQEGDGGAFEGEGVLAADDHRWSGNLMAVGAGGGCSSLLFDMTLAQAVALPDNWIIG
ncbi:MAG: hypothetical protein A2075_06935 [Geobacteraceae bacterium GWC2_58_44]|nr:MAG: hypothetical protein A2075_06935 [Geobacteraceae bacterium GWC2_58_44]